MIRRFFEIQHPQYYGMNILLNLRLKSALLEIKHTRLGKARDKEAKPVDATTLRIVHVYSIYLKNAFTPKYKEASMLSFAEEIYLLALDDMTGKLPPGNFILSSVLIGAVLGELSFLRKIDSDLKYIHILNTEPTRDPILDRTLASLKEMKAAKKPISDCLGILLPNAREIEGKVLDQLVEKKIVKEIEGKILWVIPTRRYPVIDNRQIKDVETRLRELVLGDDIPHPRETVLVSLVHICGFFSQILSPREFRRKEERIKNLARMDVVGRNIEKLIIDLNQVLWEGALPISV